MFEYVYHHLDPGGFFLNIDVVLSPTDDLEKWYLMLWQEWIDTHAANSQKASLLAVPQRYKYNVDNVPDPLLPQLQAWRESGLRTWIAITSMAFLPCLAAAKQESSLVTGQQEIGVTPLIMVLWE